MLKIKDRINLKLLEKFGFKLNFDGDYEFDINDNISQIVVFTRDYKDDEIKKGQIALRSGYYGDSPNTYFSEELNIIYDLIEADFIEKI